MDEFDVHSLELLRRHFSDRPVSAVCTVPDTQRLSDLGLDITGLQFSVDGHMLFVWNAGLMISILRDGDPGSR